MKKNRKGKHKYQWLWIAMVCFISLSALWIAGCAGKTSTSTVTTETTGGALGSGSVSSVTTDKEVVTSAHPRGVIGGLFYTIGQIIIFPFRVIGNLFS